MHRGHFKVPFGMVVRGGRRQSICHPALHVSQRSIFVRQTDSDIFGSDSEYHQVEARTRLWRGGR